MGSNTKAALLALLAFGIYATHDVLVKFLGGQYHSMQLIFFSVMFSFPLTLMMLVRDPKPGTLKPVHPWWVALRTVAAVTAGMSVFYAFTVLPLTQVYAIIFATPLLITVLSIPLLGEKVRLRRWVAVIVGLFGVIVVLRPWGGESYSLGHLAALVAAVAGAFSAIVLRKIGGQERSVVILLYPAFANFIFMGAALPFVYQPMPLSHLGVMALMALLAMVGGLVSIQAYKMGEAVIVAPMQYSQIIWATAFGLIFFAEGIDFWTATGSAIIICSGLYIVLREGRSDASNNLPVLNTKPRSDTGHVLRSGTGEPVANLAKNLE